MYGLKKEIDLRFLKDRELIQVAVGLHQISFRFDEDVAISVEGDFRYSDGQDEWIGRPEPGPSQVAARALALLGATITSFESNENGTLILTFSNGHRLTMLDSSKEYESYDISRPGENIVVLYSLYRLSYLVRICGDNVSPLACCGNRVEVARTRPFF